MPDHNHEPQDRFMLILPQALTARVKLMRDLMWPDKPIAYTCHKVLDERYAQMVSDMQTKDEVK